MAADLAAAESTIERELGLELCFRDPGVATFGLHNALYPVGDKLLEVVSPTQDGTTAGRLLSKRGGDSGYMVIFQVDDLAALRRRFDEVGARVVFEATLEGITGLHLHPRDVGGAIVSVDETDEWDNWQWAGSSWRDHVATDVVSDIVAVEVEAEDPTAMAARWHEVLGGALDGATVQFDEGRIDFVPTGDRGEGVCGLVLKSAGDEHRQIEICGTTVTLEPND